MMSRGVTLEDARTYNIIGCVEPVGVDHQLDEVIHLSFIRVVEFVKGFHLGNISGAGTDLNAPTNC